MAVKVGFASLNREAVRQYSPVKNNVKDAAAKQQAGLEPACASAGEMDVYVRLRLAYLLSRCEGQ
jgi:hypothetical protein